MYELYGKLRTLLLGVCRKTSPDVVADIGELEEYMDTEAHNVILQPCLRAFVTFSLRRPHCVAPSNLSKAAFQSCQVPGFWLFARAKR